MSDNIVDFSQVKLDKELENPNSRIVAVAENDVIFKIKSDCSIEFNPRYSSNELAIKFQRYCNDFAKAIIEENNMLKERLRQHE